MGPGRISLVAAVSLTLAGCGGASRTAPATEGRTLHGVTETGMKLEVETFVSPRHDRELAQLDAYRAAGHFPAVDYHRVVADNTHGSEPDSGRVITFAPDAQAIASGQGVPAQFSCDVLRFQWAPPNAALDGRYRALRRGLCADGPPKPDGIEPGRRDVYYLITPRGFEERGLNRLRVFGPESAELK
jgi:hypothetical protein